MIRSSCKFALHPLMVVSIEDRRTGAALDQAILRNRLLTPNDVGDAAAWIIADHPTTPHLRQSLASLMSTLVAEQAIKGIVIEGVSAGATEYRLVGLGLSAFVEPQLMDSYLATPCPFVFVDLLERTARRETQALGPGRIARDNAGDGLDLIVHYLQRGWDLSSPLWRAVGAMGHKTYVEHHRGYHLRRALQEDWTTNCAIYLAAGYREHGTLTVDPQTLPATFAIPSPTRTLFFADATDINSRAPGSTVSYVFQRLQPRCGFPLSEQRLLERAVEGATDKELAVLLDLSPTTIKSLWRQIYRRVTVHVPLVLPQGDVEDENKRGAEKRRRVISFVRDHPEEIRPFAKSRSA